MKPPVPLHDKTFVWIPSRDHDAGSDAFRERQRARMKDAQQKPMAAVPITSIARRKPR